MLRGIVLSRMNEPLDFVQIFSDGLDHLQGFFQRRPDGLILLQELLLTIARAARDLNAVFAIIELK